MQKTNSKDYLFILKKDNIESIDEIKRDLWINKDNTINLDWCDTCCFDNKKVKICANFQDKLCYLFASLHEDTMLINIVKKIIPDVSDIILPPKRYAYGFNFKAWMKKYDFTITEFLTNKKYVVVSDNIRREIENIVYLGLFDWDNIEKSSLEN